MSFPFPFYINIFGVTKRYQDADRSRVSMLVLRLIAHYRDGDGTTARVHRAQV